MTTRDQLIAVAHEHLPPPAIDPWVSLLRPGLQLKPATGTQPIVGHFGGAARMPESEPWPPSDFHLDHLLTLDLAALPDNGLDLPTDGHLVFFAATNGEMAAALRYYPAATVLSPRPAPDVDDSIPVEHIPLTAVECWTVPDPHHPYLAHIADLIDEHEWANAPAEGTVEYDDFLNTETPLDRDAYRNATVPPDSSVHLIGGYGRDIQYSADYAPTAQPVPVPTVDGAVADTELPILLAQIDSDSIAGIRWGDFGTALWTIDRADLAQRRFDKAMFHWNCH